MKLGSIRIENFRSFDDVTITFDDYNCFTGPNGTGKSTILTALNVFFRNTSSAATDVLRLNAEDFHHKNTSKPVRITVTFTELSEAAQEEFKHYFRQGQLVVTAEAAWNDDKKCADVLQHGQRLVMPEFARFFEAEEAGAKVSDLKEIYTELRGRFDDLSRESVKAQMISALREYEENHPDLCKLQPDSDQFYGWSKGANRLEKYLQWVYVPAVKDASTEQEEGSKSALGELLQRSVRMKVSFDEPIAGLKMQTDEQYRQLLDNENPALESLGQGLEARLRNWSTPTACVRLNWHYDPQKSVVINSPVARAQIGEDAFVGEVSRLGHGMQRAFIVSVLQELASASDDNSPTLVLGFEEPELYQHPSQARHIADLLEELADPRQSGSQIVITTHSPYFVSSQQLQSVRAVRKCQITNRSEVHATTFDEIEQSLADALGRQPCSPTLLMASIEQIMQPSQRELFFCRCPVLVEGLEDVAFISTWLKLRHGWSDFRKFGCHFVIASGKVNLSRPLAIANALNIPTFVVFDSDADVSNAEKRKENERNNSCVLRLCGLAEFDSLPDENLWHDRGVMWQSNIAKVICDDFGQEKWDEAEKKARTKHGFVDGVRQKNQLLVAATLEELHGSGLASSSILDQVCNKLLEFAMAASTVFETSGRALTRADS